MNLVITLLFSLSVFASNDIDVRSCLEDRDKLQLLINYTNKCMNSGTQAADICRHIRLTPHAVHYFGNYREKKELYKLSNEDAKTAVTQSGFVQLYAGMAAIVVGYGVSGVGYVAMGLKMLKKFPSAMKTAVKFIGRGGGKKLYQAATKVDRRVSWGLIGTGETAAYGLTVPGQAAVAFGSTSDISAWSCPENLASSTRNFFANVPEYAVRGLNAVSGSDYEYSHFKVPKIEKADPKVVAKCMAANLPVSDVEKRFEELLASKSARSAEKKIEFSDPGRKREHAVNVGVCATMKAMTVHMEQQLMNRHCRATIPLGFSLGLRIRPQLNIGSRIAPLPDTQSSCLLESMQMAQPTGGRY